MSDVNDVREMSLMEIAMQCKIDSQRWFPDMYKGEDLEAIVSSTAYHVLCTNGEAGEAANKMKKVIRGSVRYWDAQDDILDELIDAFIYIMNAFAVNGRDPMEFYRAKRAFNEERWGPKAVVPQQGDARD